MTKHEAMALNKLYNRLGAMGFDLSEQEALVRIERTLQRWAERECNGEVERDEQTGKPYYSLAQAGIGGGGEYRRWPVPDREKGALRRLAVLMEKHPLYQAYHQTDPRGCALYIVLRSDVPDGSDISSCYNLGLAVCV